MKRFILFFCLLLTFRGYATHVVASDISYKCLTKGNAFDTYEINLTLYRDCAGVDLSNQVQVSVSSSFCAVSQILILDAIGNKQEIYLSCLTQPTSCTTGYTYGVQTWSYSGLILLQHCPDWIFSFSVCCRNAAITTVNNSSTYQLYSYATLDNTDTCVTSAQFSDLPVLVLCTNTESILNSGAVNYGDSLKYQLVNPRGTSNIKVPYRSGYDSTHFVKGSITLQSDGTLVIKPTQVEVSIYSVKILEYINGKLVSTVTRDAQILVINSGCCSSPLPIELLEFSGKQVNEDILITWSTASETNSDYFILYTFKDSMPPRPIYKTYGAGNSSVALKYSFEDTMALRGSNNFILKEYDYDGNTTSSYPISVNFKPSEEHEFWMNYYNLLGQEIK